MLNEIVVYVDVSWLLSLVDVFVCDEYVLLSRDQERYCLVTQ